MEAENVPVNKLDNKISRSVVKITALGQIKGQLSALKSALVDLQTPANFSKQTVKFSNTSAATAEFTATATASSYQLDVISLAQPSIWNISGFSSEETALLWYANTPVDAEADRSDFTPTVLKGDDGVYVLSLQAYSNTALFGSSGGGSALTSGSLSGLEDYGTDINFSLSQESLDAEFTLNGVAFTRSSNTVSDALTGITINLTATTETAITFTVSNEAVSARHKLDALVKAYNDLYTLYKSQTAPSIDVAGRGILNSDFSVSSMMRQLISGLMLDITNITGEALEDSDPTDLSAMGLELLDSGYLAVNETLLATASSTLQTRLSEGIRIGYSDESDSDLATQIADMIFSGGVIQDRIDSEIATKSDLTKRKTTLQERLVGVQARYTAQFASLDAMLFRLQGTSDSLKSALDGLINSQKNS